VTTNKSPARAAKLPLKQQLAQREAELSIINSIQQGLASRLDVQSIYDLVGDKIRDIFRTEVVMISTYDQQTATIEHRYAIERGERVYAPGRFPIRGFRTQIVQTRLPILVNSNVAEQAAILGQPTLPGTITPKSWLGVPMLVGDQVTGILSLQNVDHENAFTESGVRLLQTLAASMSVALENARLWTQEKVYLTALEHEFKIGREIQIGFLPDTLPQLKGWDVAAFLQPAREVAGDFYDVFELPGKKIGLVIADICDKGLGAALFMTLFRSFIRAVSNIDFYARTGSENQNSSAERLRNAISLTNNYISETHGNTGMFATIFFGILDTSTGSLNYINGGHLPPLIIDKHGIKHILHLTGPGVGASSDAEYAIREVLLDLDDTFFSCTDGLTEAENVAGVAFNEQELIPLFTGNQTLSSVLLQVYKIVETYISGTQQNDDITMLAVKRTHN
jgi:phosphoserine phosphatase RsbU/P